MVGVFWRFSGYTKAHPSLLEYRNGSQAIERDGEYESDSGNDGDAVVVQFDGTLKPVEHLPEPVDDDQPANFPAEGMWQELEKMHRRADLLASREATGRQQPPKQAHPRRQHRARYPSAPPSSRISTGQFLLNVPIF